MLNTKVLRPKAGIARLRRLGPKRSRTPSGAPRLLEPPPRSTAWLFADSVCPPRRMHCGPLRALGSGGRRASPGRAPRQQRTAMQQDKKMVVPSHLPACVPSHQPVSSLIAPPLASLHLLLLPHLPPSRLSDRTGVWRKGQVTMRQGRPIAKHCTAILCKATPLNPPQGPRRVADPRTAFVLLASPPKN